MWSRSSLDCILQLQNVHKYICLQASRRVRWLMDYIFGFTVTALLCCGRAIVRLPEHFFSSCTNASFRIKLSPNWYVLLESLFTGVQVRCVDIRSRPWRTQRVIPSKTFPWYHWLTSQLDVKKILIVSVSTLMVNWKKLLVLYLVGSTCPATTCCQTCCRTSSLACTNESKVCVMCCNHIFCAADVFASPNTTY